MPDIDLASLDSIDIVSGTGTQRLHRFSANAKQLGEGGAGVVFAHGALPGQALKVYRTTEQAIRHAEKVRAMVVTPPRAVRTAHGTVQIAWPTATILHRNDLVGFAMPSVDFKQAWTLQKLIKPTQRRRHRIPERMQLRVYAGLNLALVLQSLHDIGHHVVDLKPQNVLVYRDDAGRSASHIALVDCDGFQISGPAGRRYDAELATPEFLYPDVSVQLDDGTISFDARLINNSAREQDNFALAIILFELLNNSLHPMQGRVKDASEVPTDLAARLHGRGRFYAYGQRGRNVMIRPDEDSLHSWFDPKLRDLFDGAFDGSVVPPPPQKWAKTLEFLASSGRLCERNPDHWILGPVCGQCAQAARARPTPQPKSTSPRPPMQATLPPTPSPQLTRPAPSTTVTRSPSPQLTQPTSSTTVTLSMWVTLCVIWRAICTLFLVAARVLSLLLRLPWWGVVSVLAGIGFMTWSGLTSFRAPGPPRAMAFVAEFFRSCSDNAGSDTQICSSAYAAKVDYYGILRTSSEVHERKRQFISDWPKRSYGLRTDTVEVSCEATMCRVTVVVIWSIWSSVQCRNGVSKYVVEMNMEGASPRIFMENSQPLRPARAC